MTLAYAALWIFVLALPWENLILIPGFGTISRVTGLLAVGLALLGAVISGRFRRWHGFHIAAVLFVAISGIVLMATSAAIRLPYKFTTYVQLVAVLWVMWELAQTKRRVHGLLVAFVLGAYVAAFHTIIAYRAHVGVFRRFSGEGFDANDLANILALALPIAWYLGMTYRQPLLRWVCRGFLLVGLVAIGLTGSRGGLLVAIVALMVVPLTMTKLSPGKLAMGIFLLAISGALAVKYVPEAVVERLATTRGELQGGSLGGRMRIWRAGMEVYLDAPVLGHGVGTFPIVVTPLLGSPRASHNSFLAVLVEQGIVGFLLFLAMFLAVFLALLGLPPLERRFGLVLLATLTIAMIPLSWEDSKPAWFVLAALVGLSYARVDRNAGAVHESAPARSRSLIAGRAAARRRPPLTAPARRADGDART